MQSISPDQKDMMDMMKLQKGKQKGLPLKGLLLALALLVVMALGGCDLLKENAAPAKTSEEYYKIYTDFYNAYTAPAIEWNSELEPLHKDIKRLEQKIGALKTKRKNQEELLALTKELHKVKDLKKQIDQIIAEIKQDTIAAFAPLEQTWPQQCDKENKGDICIYFGELYRAYYYILGIPRNEKYSLKIFHFFTRACKLNPELGCEKINAFELSEKEKVTVNACLPYGGVSGRPLSQVSGYTGLEIFHVQDLQRLVNEEKEYDTAIELLCSQGFMDGNFHKKIMSLIEIAYIRDGKITAPYHYCDTSFFLTNGTINAMSHNCVTAILSSDPDQTKDKILATLKDAPPKVKLEFQSFWLKLEKHLMQFSAKEQVYCLRNPEMIESQIPRSKAVANFLPFLEESLQPHPNALDNMKGNRVDYQQMYQVYQRQLQQLLSNPNYADDSCRNPHIQERAANWALLREAFSKFYVAYWRYKNSPDSDAELRNKAMILGLEQTTKVWEKEFDYLEYKIATP